jgi:hypothetical protein
MNSKESEKKKCENYKYFCQHYTKIHAFYNSVFCGHCLKNYTNTTFKKFRANNTACKLWESIDIQKEERKESIKRTLKNMAEQINEIAMILQEDTNDIPHNR